ncbi:MAG: MqnA/MqnD/SBP family protein [Bdellovibrionota bacterium]
MRISIAHSPDADDYFLFWALRKNLLDPDGFAFDLVELDTEDLNSASRSGKYDVCAVSTAAYSDLADRYHVLSSGASVGRNFGPTLVSASELAVSELAHARIGIPGRTTTAAAVLRQLVPSATTVEIPLTPYEAVFDAIKERRVDAAVLIHEGQIAFRERQLFLVTDLGRWWHDRTGLPLPLGINVIRKALGDSVVSRLARLFRRSVEFALAHQSELLPELFEMTQRSRKKLATPELLDRYLGMYANRDSIALDSDCKRAIELLCPAAKPSFTE